MHKVRLIFDVHFISIIFQSIYVELNTTEDFRRVLEYLKPLVSRTEFRCVSTLGELNRDMHGVLWNFLEGIRVFCFSTSLINPGTSDL